jgi:hypothetical protein
MRHSVARAYWWHFYVKALWSPRVLFGSLIKEQHPMTHSSPATALKLGVFDVKQSIFGFAGLAFFSVLAVPAQSAPITISIEATVDTVIDGSVSGLMVDDLIAGAFVYDTDEANADPVADTDGSDRPGHEYSSFYEFSGSPYAVTLDVPFSSTAPVAVVVNNDLPLTADETAGQISDGIYDWIEILGSTTISVCNKTPPEECEPGEFDPADGQEWTLAIIADSGWFSDGSLIPDTLPGTYTALIVAQEFDENSFEAGVIVASVDSLVVAAVPVPGAVWLFGSALGLLGWARRRTA